MSDFKAKKAPNLISAVAPPQTHQGSSQRSPDPSLPRPRSQPCGPRNNLPPRIYIPKSAYVIVIKHCPSGAPLATCLNYAKINNSVFTYLNFICCACAVTFPNSCKVNTGVFVILLQLGSASSEFFE